MSLTVTHKERQERAIRAAVAVADRLGMTSVTPVILKDSNHTSIHLAPFPVVARVVAPSVGQGASAALSAELSVAEHLARAGAPIVAPTIDVPPGPHLEANETMTLWQFVAHCPAEETDGPVAAEGLREIHSALGSYLGDCLPSRSRLTRVGGCCKRRRGCPPLLRRTSSFFSRNTTGCGGCLPPRPLRLLPFTVTHILGTC